jgi:hypothetical protein
MTCKLCNRESHLNSLSGWALFKYFSEMSSTDESFCNDICKKRWYYISRKFVMMSIKSEKRAFKIKKIYGEM